MESSITAKFKEGFNLEEHDYIKVGDSDIDSAVLPFITGKKEWEQYFDDMTYQTDKAMREWLTEMRQNKTWCRTRKARTYQFKQLFRIVFKREYDPKTDSKYSNRIARVFNYYCVTKRSSCKNDQGEWRAKPGYVIGANRVDLPPYSLRLRYEEMLKEGKVPNYSNMKIPDDLKTGHSRNPNTDANMEKRRQQGRDRYNEYQRKRNDEIKARSNEGQES